MRLLRASVDYQYRLLMPAGEGGFWHLWHLDPPAHDKFASDQWLVPFVNDGRWMVGCPGCGGAQLTGPDIDRFYCVDCANAWAGHQWVLVQWSDDHEHAERELVKRDHPNQCNWQPDEQDWLELVAENIRYGAGDASHLTKRQQTQVRKHVAAQNAGADATAIVLVTRHQLPDGTVRTLITDEARKLGFGKDLVKALKAGS